MKTYTIPIIYQRCEKFTVKAENLQDAVKQALDTFLATPDDNYLEDSFEIDGIVEDNYPDEEYDVFKTLE